MKKTTYAKRIICFALAMLLLLSVSLNAMAASQYVRGDISVGVAQTVTIGQANFTGKTIRLHLVAYAATAGTATVTCYKKGGLLGLFEEKVGGSFSLSYNSKTTFDTLRNKNVSGQAAMFYWAMPANGDYWFKISFPVSKPSIVLRDIQVNSY
jgi:putative hemolysin